MTKHEIELTRRIRFDGADSDFMYFSTPSWSRPNAGISHTIAVDKREGIVSCTCESAAYGKKHSWMLDEAGTGGCKHIKIMVKNFARILRSGE